MSLAKICPTCGHVNSPYDLCCQASGCGADISAVVATPTAPAAPPAPPSSPERPGVLASCPQCGAENTTQAGSCRTCFADLADADPSAAQPEQTLTLCGPEGVCIVVGTGEAIGRGAVGASVLAPFAGVSREHARFLHQDAAWLVEDLGSTNGTTVNGRRLTPHQPTPVHDGDTLGVCQALSVTVRLPGANDGH